jgi:hypothetical protein
MRRPTSLNELLMFKDESTQTPTDMEGGPMRTPRRLRVVLRRGGDVDDVNG